METVFRAQDLTSTRNPASEVSTRQAAMTAGISYLLIFVLAIFANFFAIERLVVPGDAGTTTQNIMESEGLLRGGLAAFIVVFVLDVVIAWGLYIVFRQINRDWSLLQAGLRIVGATLLGASLIFLYLVLQLVGRAESLAAFDRGQLDAQVMTYLSGFDFLWLIGLFCFGVHLIVVAYLILRSGYVPKLLGYLLILAGAAYAVDTLAHALLPDYAAYGTVFLIIVAASSIVAELWLALWLVLKGGRATALPRTVDGSRAGEAIHRARTLVGNETN
jgi:hypothetical protein